MPRERRSTRQERTMAKLVKESNALAAKQLRADRKRARRAKHYRDATPPTTPASPPQPAPWDTPQEETREP
jgi:hypothetical protein